MGLTATIEDECEQELTSRVEDAALDVRVGSETTGRSRRDLFRFGSLAGAGALAAACAPAGPGAPVPTAPPPSGGGGTGPGGPVSPPAWSSATGLHIARRLTWGSTPALAASIEQRGLESWLNEQLNPGALNDSHLAPMLAPWPRPLQSALQLKDAG
ncbi:MAG: hypothetical protein ACK5O2_06455, partial [Microthrixaceae bacterium]